MDETQKKKIAGLILERLVADGCDWMMGATHIGFISSKKLDQTLDMLVGNGFEAVLRHKSRRVPGRSDLYWDPMPEEKEGKIKLNLLISCMGSNPKNQKHWKQVWIYLDKETAMKILVLGFFPEKMSP
jgi:hypothetical protein